MDDISAPGLVNPLVLPAFNPKPSDTLYAPWARNMKKPVTSYGFIPHVTKEFDPETRTPEQVAISYEVKPYRVRACRKMV